MNLFTLKTEIEIEIQRAIQNLATLGAQVNQVAADIQERIGQPTNVNIQTGQAVSSLNNLNSTIKRQESELNQLKKQYSNVVLEQGDTSNEAKRLAGEIDHLSRKLQDNRNRLNQATQAADQFDNSLEDAGNTAKKTEGKMSGTFAKIGAAVAAAFAVKKIVDFGKAAIQASADVAAEQSAFTQIMGEYTDQAAAKVSKIAEATGMVDTRLTPYMTSMTAKFKGLGYGVNEATDYASRGLNLAADASAFWDKSLDESMSHLNSFINGSYEGGEAIGLFANDTQMAAYAVEKGLVKTTAQWSSLDEATKQATRLEYAENMMKASGAVGQASKESGQYANVLANLTETWRQFKAVIGEPLLQALLPIVQQLTKSIEQAMPTIQTITSRLLPVLLDLVDKLLPPLMQMIDEILPLLVEVLEILLPPLIEIVTAILPVVTNIIKAILPPLMELLRKIMPGLVEIITALIEVINPILELLSPIIDLVTALTEPLIELLTMILPPLIKVISAVAKVITAVLKPVIEIITKLFRNSFNKEMEETKKKQEALGNAIKNIWNGIKNFFSNILNGIKNTFSNVWNGIKSTTTNVWNGIKNAITTPINKAKDTVKAVIEKIKGLFKFNWSLPKLKVPKFSISPSGWKVGDLLKGKIPKLGVTWNADGAIFNKPAIFNTQYGLQGVGEAGAEAIAPIDKLNGYVRQAVKDETEGLSYSISRVYDILANYFPQILANINQDVVLNDGTLVGKLTPAINAKLGEIQKGNTRGR